MRSVGGHTMISSAVGRGSTVSLRWSLDGDDTTEPVTKGSRPGDLAVQASTGPVAWDRSTFTPLVAIGLAILVGHVAMGFLTLDQFTQPLVASVLSVLVIANTVLVAGASLTRSGLALSMFAAAAMSAVLAGTLVDPSAWDWRYWFVGAHTMFVGALGLRWGTWPSLLSALSIPGAAALGHVVAGHDIQIGPVLAGVPQLVGTAVVGTFFQSR